MEVELEFRALFLHDSPPQEYSPGYTFIINSLNGQRSPLDTEIKKNILSREQEKDQITKNERK